MEAQTEATQFILENWKRIPVEYTKVLMDTFPYVLPPWEHWNRVVDTLKNKQEEQEHSETRETRKVSPKKEIDDTKEIIKPAQINSPNSLTSPTSQSLRRSRPDWNNVDWESSDDDF